MPSWPSFTKPWALILEQEISDVFAVQDRQVLDGTVRFHGQLLVPPDTAMTLLAPRLEPLGFVALLHSGGEMTLVRLAGARRIPGGWKGWPLNLVLFLATLGTTLFVGAVMEGASPLQHPAAILAGVPFSASLLLILGCHELGHYLTARSYGVQVSLPYFVPLPLPPMGTMGAIIRMRSPIPNRKVLFDIGISGPLLGLVVAVPVLVLGLILSPVKPMSGMVLQEGNSLAYLLLKWLLKGPIPPGADVMLHPMAMAGWLGFFVTALNLLPLSQLDGGHIAYASIGPLFRKVVWVFLGALVILFLASRWEGWLVWVVLTVLLGLRHPPPLDDLTPLDPARRRLAVVAMVLLIALLPPVPLAILQF
jgi:membrane-associated protease RseP (regulator of RpoE activity)